MKALKASVKFINDFEKQRRTDKDYHYLSLIADLQEGDFVVVETRHGYAVAEFIEYIDDFSVNSSSYIIQKVELDQVSHEKERQRNIKRLKSEIDEKAKAALQRKKLDELAAEDSELKILLDKLDGLEK
ncbi:hypothetical protein [Enterococcus wangshanyuanii]|uniref:Uncharacterized protein n=1 Tax=Enterococcus wangshanyuanii TaxID=2005703 RepID=A0ABQ1NEL9_9ENTE|nr:hypothetical protein [Enterococcus wangshanyuanii]GGC74771.1 hypothetical protein GCM10011573_00360 [Enterococcus wangshanyuanii]